MGTTLRTTALALLTSLALTLGAGVGAATAADPMKLSHRTAAARLAEDGIPVRSSGNCSNRNRSNCTSLDQIRRPTIEGVRTLKRASRCAVVVTGGTETGHASGRYSHWNGYKIDLAMSSCLTNYIKRNYRSIGGNKWRSPAGNIYYYEGNHWDITYY